MEIEAKFRIDDPADFALLVTLDRLGAYVLQSESDREQQHNTYYDTIDGLLRAAHYGLRIREVGTRKIVTLKGPNQGCDGRYQRDEWEAIADSPDPSTWPAGPARDQAQALLGATPLVALLTIRTTRQHIIVSLDARNIAEMSLDDGEIITPRGNETFRELEIELLPSGINTDLDKIITALGAHLTLLPEPRSKLERGLALLNLP